MYIKLQKNTYSKTQKKKKDREITESNSWQSKSRQKGVEIYAIQLRRIKE